MNSNIAQPLLVNEDDDDINILDRQSLDGPRKTSSCAGFLQMRYVLIVLLCFGSFNIYATRVTMSMGLVCMVNHTAILQNSYPASTGENTSTSGLCIPTQDHMGNGTNTNISEEDGPFVWDEELQGIILSSFFWGYVFTQLPGGVLADKFGGKWVYVLSVLPSSLLTMTIPTAAQVHPYLVVLSRILCGLAQGLFFPTTFSIASKWFPKQERSRFVALSGLGVALGTIFAYPVSAVLCTSNFLGGWPAIFYVIGSVGVLWFVFWCLLMFESPAEHPWISAEERCYIEQNCFCNSARSQIKIPWKSILTSPHVLSLCVYEFCSAYKYFMMLTQLPTYLKVILNYSIEQNGYINTVSSMLAILIALLSSFTADFLITKNVFGITSIRKAFTSAGQIMASVCLFGVTIVGCDRIWIVILLLISSSIDGLTLGGAQSNSLDLSPNFTGVIKGILNTMAAAAGVASPYIVGVLIKDNNTKSSWDIAFYLAVGLSIFGTLVYLLFGSGNTQPWNNDAMHGNETADVENNEKIVTGNKTQLVQ